MLEQDYLMKLLMQFFQAIARSYELKDKGEDPSSAADLLEDAVGNATEMDGATLLSLAPESIAQVMKVSGVDPNVTQFVARSLLLESVYLTEAHRNGLAMVRAAQARAIAEEYGFDLPEDPSDFETITAGLEEAAEAGGFYDEAGMYREAMGEDDFLSEILEGTGISLDEPETFEDPNTYFEPESDDKEDPRQFGYFIDFE